MPASTGIFGSTFNPPHNAHFSLAETAREHFQLEKIIYIPTRIPPHKKIEGDWNDLTRSLMIRVASFSDTPDEVERLLKANPSVKKDTAVFVHRYSREYGKNHDPGVSVSDMEIQRPDVSYSIDTVKTLLEKDPDRKLFLIIGMDQAAVFDTWKDWKELPKLTVVCAGNRPGYDESVVRHKFPFIRIFAIPPSEVSSTGIREKIAKNQSIQGLVPKIIEDLLKIL